MSKGSKSIEVLLGIPWYEKPCVMPYGGNNDKYIVFGRQQKSVPGTGDWRSVSVGSYLQADGSWSDSQHVFPSKEEAHAAFDALGSDPAGEVSLSALALAFGKAGNDRKGDNRRRKGR